MSTATRASRRPSPGAPGAARHILVVVDSDGCAPPRPATPAEASAAASALAAEAAWVPTDGPVRRTGGGSPPARRPTLAPRPGGPCDHCGCRESPQWRRGPASKPVLCNACGTRYRRTNSLTPATAPAVAAAEIEAWARVEIEA